jgi:hypothetical protein
MLMKRFQNQNLKAKLILSGVISAILVAGCGFMGAPTSITSTEEPTLTATQAPTATPEPLPPTATDTPEALVLSPLDPATVAFDFIALRCDAQWSNSGEDLSCPGDLEDVGSGYVGLEIDPMLEGGFSVAAQALLTIPAHEGSYGGIFGRYPPFTVQHGDSLRGVLACQQDDEPCDVGFDVMYFDSSGEFHTFPGSGPPPFDVSDASGGNHIFLDLPLDALADQTVEFVLGVRDEGDAAGGRALWVRPYIWRDPDYVPPTSTPESKIPGVIAGWVDMAAAPPYMKDPVINPEGIPVVVMAFNQDDATWWWFHTTATHPYYQMTVPPGDYLVVAYGRGVADVPYVTAGYTGMNPSCGQALALMTVAPNAFVDGIVIADWNWNCGGTAYRPPKPDEVPLP